MPCCTVLCSPTACGYLIHTGEKGQGGAQAQDDSSAPSWQGQTSEAGYVPAVRAQTAHHCPVRTPALRSSRPSRGGLYMWIVRLVCPGLTGECAARCRRCRGGSAREEGTSSSRDPPTRSVRSRARRTTRSDGGTRTIYSCRGILGGTCDDTCNSDTETANGCTVSSDIQ